MKDTFEITIPVLNEEKNLKQGLVTLYDFIRSNFTDYRDFSIVIADNGSTDGTQEIANNILKKYSCVKYIRLKEKGVGRALRTSWSQSEASVVGFLDLDLATSLKHLPDAISAISEKGYDIAYGTRLHKNSKVIGRSLKREFVTRVFNFILKSYLDISFSDGMCGFKFLKRRDLDRIIDGGAISNGWFFSAELLIVGEWYGYKLFELPVEWTDDSDSRVKVPSLTIEFLKSMKVLKKKKSRINK
jgi:glycosyltransferase involved in cell wall biosynthesis